MQLLPAVSLAAMLTGMTAGLGIAAVPSDQARQANAQNATETNTQSKQQADQARQEGQANQSAAGQTTGSGSSVGPGAGGDTANTPLGYAKGTHESSQVGKQR